ncbi:acyltransferase family protein [Leptospira interrogans]
MGTVRFLLALCVVATHSPGGAIFGITMMSGITAVQCFYVISGFLITMILNEREDYKNLGTFYLSRYLRIWPVYILITALTLYFFQWPAITSELPRLTNWSTYAFILLSNLTIFFQDWFVFLKFENGGLAFTPVFHTLHGPQPYWFEIVPQAWTLGVELTFYAIAPFVCRRWWGAVGLLAFGIAVRMILAGHFGISLNSAFLYRFAPAEMMLFGAGAVMYFVGRLICPLVPKLTIALCIFFVLAFSYMSFFKDHTNQLMDHYFGGSNIQQLLLGNYPILIMMTLAVPSLFYGTRTLRFDRLLGEMSYPMYICHVLIFTLINTYLPAGAQLGNALYVVLVLATSLALVLLLILPIDNVRRSLGRRDKADFAVTPPTVAATPH